MTTRYSPIDAQLVQLFLPNQLVQQIDAWRRTQTKIPPRSEAIRQLIADELKGKSFDVKSTNDTEISLRVAIERAQAGSPDAQVREWLQWLLDQKSDAYGTLIDECEVAIHG